jgi:hypothetical protein
MPLRVKKLLVVIEERVERWGLWQTAHEVQNGVFTIPYSQRCNQRKRFPSRGQGIAPIQLPVRKPTLSETIHKRPMRAGCWRLFHTLDPMFDPLRNDPRFQKLATSPAPK